MYHVLKTVIQTGNYKLEDMRHKVKKMHLLGDLSEAQMDELLTQAALSANPEAERPEVLQMLMRLSEKVDALARQVAQLKGEAGADTYETWKSWDGLSRDYQPGAVVSHGGKLWQSVYEGQNVWEPGSVDERFWVEYREV